MVSGLAVDGWPPTWSMASTSDVNSWPSGMPAKRTATSVPTRSIANDGRRTPSSSRATTVIWSDEGGDLVEELVQLGRLGAVVERRDQLDRPGDLREVGLQLRGQVGVEHGELQWRRGSEDERRTERRRGGTGPGRSRPRDEREASLRSCRRGRATGRGSRRPLPTWPGRPRPGAPRTYWAALTLRSSSDRVAADALGGDLEELDHAVGVDEERAAVGQALALAEHVEVAG